MNGPRDRELSENTTVLPTVTLPTGARCAWPARDLDILETVTRRVRVLETSQLRRIWWPKQPTNRFVRRRLNTLAQAGLLQRTIVNAHPLLPLSTPLFMWRPGRGGVDSRRVSGQARLRWSKVSQPIEVWTATRRTANLFGSDGYGLPPLWHRDHDLLLSQVYVFYRTHRQQEVRHWLGEDALPKAGYRVKDPDAFLLSGDGRPKRVIESAGRYGPRQIDGFHEHCACSNLPYELW